MSEELIQQELNSNNETNKVLEEVMSYYRLKKLLSAKLNRVVWYDFLPK